MSYAAASIHKVVAPPPHPAAPSSLCLERLTLLTCHLFLACWAAGVLSLPSPPATHKIRKCPIIKSLVQFHGALFLLIIFDCAYQQMCTL